MVDALYLENKGKKLNTGTFFILNFRLTHIFLKITMHVKQFAENKSDILKKVFFYY